MSSNFTGLYLTTGLPEDIYIFIVRVSNRVTVRLGSTLSTVQRARQDLYRKPLGSLTPTDYNRVTPIELWKRHGGACSES